MLANLLSEPESDFHQPKLLNWPFCPSGLQTKKFQTCPILPQKFMGIIRGPLSTHCLSDNRHPAFPKAGVTDRLVSDFKLDSGSLRLSGCGTLTDGECRIRFRRLLEVLVWRCWFHIQSRTTKGRKFYFAWMKEIWAKLTSDSDSDGLETSENDSFFRIFPTHFLGPSKFKKNLNICIYILHRNHSPLWHCTVLFLLFYSLSSCLTPETGSISFQKPPRTVALQARYLYIVKKCSES